MGNNSVLGKEDKRVYISLMWVLSSCIHTYTRDMKAGLFDGEKGNSKTGTGRKQVINMNKVNDTCIKASMKRF